MRLVACSATLNEVRDFLLREYKPLQRFVIAETNAVGRRIKNKARPARGDLHKCEKIILWLSSFYFPYESTRIVYGPRHIPGDPKHTNGLEGKNDTFQNVTKECYSDFNLTRSQAFVKSTQVRSFDPDLFAMKPIQTTKDWNEILACGWKKKRCVKDLPPFLLHMV